jgi:DDE superfamily endonuclease
VKAARENWVDGQDDLDPEHLIFIDESGLSTKMARLRGWAPRGERCRAAIPHGHWKTITFVGGLTLAGFVAPMLLDGPMDGESFLAWVEQMLAPTLRPGDLVVMDMCGRPRWCKKNLSKSHGAWSGADMCPAFCCGCTCRGPVWEFAERVQFNLACSRRVSMIWFSRSRLVDRCAKLSD